MSNAYAIHALESTWGTAPGSGWREVEIDTDEFKTLREVQTRAPGLRRSGGAPRASNRRVTDKGATGTIGLVAATNGLGPFLACAASTATSALLPSAVTARKQEYKWTEAGPPLNRSLTTEVYRDRTTGTFDAYTYTGGRVTQLDIGQALDQMLTLKFGMDYLTAVRQASDPSRTVVEVDPQFLYNWEDPLLTLTPYGGDPEDDGNTECMSNFSLTLPANLKTDRWCLKRGTGKHEPSRNGTPAPTGSFEWDYEHPRYYDAWVARELFTVKAEWKCPVKIETVSAVDIFPTFTIDIATIEFSGDDPQASPEDPTKQTMPFNVLDDEVSSEVVKITQITSDTTL